MLLLLLLSCASLEERRRHWIAVVSGRRRRRRRRSNVPSVPAVAVPTRVLNAADMTTNDGENGATADAAVAADDAAEDAGGDRLRLFLKVRTTQAGRGGGGWNERGGGDSSSVVRAPRVSSPLGRKTFSRFPSRRGWGVGEMPSGGW